MRTIEWAGEGMKRLRIARPLLTETTGMSQRYLACAAVLLFLPHGAGAEEEQIHPPQALPPAVCLATATEKDGVVRIQVSVPRMVPFEVTKKIPYTRIVSRDGRHVPETKFVTEIVIDYMARMETTTLIADGQDVKVSRKDGTSVDPKELPKLLTARTRVLLVSDKEIDPYYLGVIDDKVLIITVPASKVSRPTKK